MGLVQARRCGAAGYSSIIVDSRALYDVSEETPRQVWGALSAPDRQSRSERDPLLQVLYTLELARGPGSPESHQVDVISKEISAVVDPDFVADAVGLAQAVRSRLQAVLPAPEASVASAAPRGRTSDTDLPSLDLRRTQQSGAA